MKIAYKHLIQHLAEKPSKKLLSEKLYQLGHEHEIHSDVFDMELTPNRGDCLSLHGLSRDLNIFFGKSDCISIYEEPIENLEIEFENLSPSDCPKISFLEIEIEEITSFYQPYLENYFNEIGNKKTNLFTDISNFISYELGQPTHCFDREAIKSKLIFENKICNNNFKTLLGSEVNLTDSNCIFSSNNQIISLAGVVGGASTACSKSTKKVLVECAYFMPESIIGKSVKYNLVSDAAHKFERGVDISSQEIVLRRFAKVVQDHAKIKSIRLKSFVYSEFQNISIPIDVKKINSILGTNIKDDKCLAYLEALGFVISNEIKVPSYRHDIKTNNDLAEEIARVIGYDNIISTPVKLKGKTGNKKENRKAMLESFLTKNGFFEVVNFPFTSTKRDESIKIDNPLDSSRRNFRVSLMNSLIENLLYNERRQRDSIKLFEISDIYTKDSGINQETKLGIIVSGRLGNNYNDFSKKLDNEYLFRLLNSDLTEDFFEIIEIPRDGLNTKKKDKIFYVEISIEKISKDFFSKLSIDKKKINFINYKPVSEYPSSTRDFSFSFNNPAEVQKVITMLDEASDEAIKDSFIFDFYQNEKTDTVKLGYRFIFQSQEKTLSYEEINKKVQNILIPILKIDGVSIPGLTLNEL